MCLIAGPARAAHKHSNGRPGKERATKPIDAKIDGLPPKAIEIKEYVRDTDLSNLSNNRAFLNEFFARTGHVPTLQLSWRMAPHP
ncbi:hypothetical protein EAS61_18345 [Bradyrhizobium zhanjiangense]|uniref:Uncharacterized protein n=1 Tax=Bradyrhizobium zhanjiangense TaxID=1325107 RepID=A0A4Q0QND5_9BRAD|nr:hypothetical protein EAS62_39880 [Bradyrhizobium zhanjiangense]RXG95802.1 hypothetical protein EAS61_18345 [Bradyrhizobium zhanjiangense]